MPCIGPHWQVVVELRVGRRALDSHLRPRGVELLGDQRRQAGVGALAHLEVLDDHGHRVVGADRQERVGREFGPEAAAFAAFAGRGLRRVDAEDAERQAARGRAVTLRKTRRPGLAAADPAADPGVDCEEYMKDLRDMRIGFIARSLQPRLLRRFLDRRADAHVGRAAADVAGHRVVDVGIARMPVLREQRRRRHQLPRLAVAALRHVELLPRRLHGQRFPRLQALDRRDVGAELDRRQRDLAGTRGLPVDQHGARAAQRHAAAVLGAR